MVDLLGELLLDARHAATHLVVHLVRRRGSRNEREKEMPVLADGHSQNKKGQLSTLVRTCIVDPLLRSLRNMDIRCLPTAGGFLDGGSL